MNKKLIIVPINSTKSSDISKLLDEITNQNLERNSNDFIIIIDEYFANKNIYNLF